MRICVVGGGSSYTPELIEGFIQYQSEVPAKTLVLMDIDRSRLDVISDFAQRMISAAGADIEILKTTNLSQAIEGSDFVINQIRVGGMAARILDEKIPLRFNIIGQETTGPGGFSKALRTIPVVINIARKIELLAPNAFLINFTNPSGLITEAIFNNSSVAVIGLCNLPIGAEMRFAELLGVKRDKIKLDWVGLNHLNWIRGIKVAGQDKWQEVFEIEVNSARHEKEDGWNFSTEILELLGMIPCGYLNYYYDHDQILHRQKDSLKSRGEEVIEIEKELFELYKNPSLDQKPHMLEKRGGAYYSKAAVSLISAIVNNKKESHIVNVRNNDSISFLSSDAVIETPCIIDKNGATPRKLNSIPIEIKGLIQSVKSYEQLTIMAAVGGDRQKAIQALMTHPLVLNYNKARGLVEAILEAHQKFLPQFFSRG